MKKTRWCNYDIAYHIVWCPKYRRKVLVNEVEEEMKRIVAECCSDTGIELFAVETDVDHVHVFVGAPPRMSPAYIAGLLKGHTAKRLREKFPFLKTRCGKESLWTRTYYVGTAGSVSKEVILRYIDECQGK